MGIDCDCRLCASWLVWLSRRGAQYFYAPARLSDKSLWLTYKDAEVWRFRRKEPAGRSYHLAPLKAVEMDDSPE